MIPLVRRYYSSKICGDNKMVGLPWAGGEKNGKLFDEYRVFVQDIKSFGDWLNNKIDVLNIIEVKVKAAQVCLTLCNPMDYTVHAILQARILEWVAFPFSRGSSNPGIEPRSPTLQADSLPAEPQGKPNYAPKKFDVENFMLHVFCHSF